MGIICELREVRDERMNYEVLLKLMFCIFIDYLYYLIVYITCIIMYLFYLLFYMSL